jgi:hypothetical protein
VKLRYDGDFHKGLYYDNPSERVKNGDEIILIHATDLSNNDIKEIKVDNVKDKEG